MPHRGAEKPSPSSVYLHARFDYPVGAPRNLRHGGYRHRRLLHRCSPQGAWPAGVPIAAVPLAIALDRLGFFTELADRLVATGRASGSLWILAALVTTVLNVDASVVLLTPSITACHPQPRSRATSLTVRPWRPTCIVAQRAARVVNVHRAVPISRSSSHQLR